MKETWRPDSAVRRECQLAGAVGERLIEVDAHQRARRQTQRWQAGALEIGADTVQVRGEDHHRDLLQQGVQHHVAHRRTVGPDRGHDDELVPGGSISPSRIATEKASSFECAPSFARMLWTWLRTVLTEMKSRVAIAPLVSPSAISWRISRSRAVRSLAGCSYWWCSRLSSRPAGRSSP